MGESEDERRRGERVPINDEFSSLAKSDDGTGTWVSDLSHGGVFVHTNELLPVGSMVDLRFTILLDDPIVIEAFGKVARHSHKPRGIGVEFAAMSPETTQRIEDVLTRRRPLDSGAPLRLPEPNASPIGLPDDDDDDDDDPTATMVFARPAPVEGLGVRRVPKQEFEDAVTASFPKIEGQAGSTGKPGSGPSDSQRMRFKAPPLPKREGPARPPQARVRETNEEDRTRVYRAIPLEPTDDED